MIWATKLDVSDSVTAEETALAWMELIWVETALVTAGVMASSTCWVRAAFSSEEKLEEEEDDEEDEEEEEEEED